MDNKPYVYKLVHNTSGQFYIGYREANEVSAKEDLGIRYKSSSKEVKRIGFDNFDIYIIKEFDTHDRNRASDEAYRFENDLIEKHIIDPLCLNKFYNTTSSRKFKLISHSEETKKKIGQSQIGKEISIESRLKMSASAKGRKASESAKINIGLAKRGIKLSDQAKTNISLGKIGHKVSDETKSKLRACNLGRKLNDETKAKISAASIIHRQKHLLTFELISPNGEVHTGTNISKFCSQHNLKNPSISQLCKGVLKGYKGWTGKYKENQ